MIRMPLISFRPSKENPLEKYFFYLFYEKKIGDVTIITGSTTMKTGCGKSYTALKLGETIDKDFGIEKVVYTPSEFLKVVDRVEEKGKYGQVIVVDEGEITAPAHLWYSFTNRAIAYTLATFRYLRSMAIFVVPTLSWLDKRIRLLANHIGFTEKIVIEGDPKVFLDFRKVVTDLYGENLYLKRIQMYDKENRKVFMLKKFRVQLPSEKLVEEYEKKSQEFKKNIRANLIREIEKFQKYEGATESLEDIVKKLIDNEDIRSDLIEKDKVQTATIKMVCPELSSKQVTIIKRMLEKMWKKRSED